MKKNNAWISNLLRIISLKLLVSGLSFLLALYIFIAFAHEVFVEKEDELDQNVIQFVTAYSTEQLYDLMEFFTFFGSSTFLFPAYVLLVSFFLLRKQKTEAIEAAVIGISSTALLRALKFLFQRSRPQSAFSEHINTFSFPSGHAMSSFVFCSLLIYFIWKSKLSKQWKWLLAILLVLFSFLVGLSRIVLQVHYASDVICGFCIGYLWVLFSLWLQKKWIGKKLPSSASPE